MEKDVQNAVKIGKNIIFGPLSILKKDFKDLIKSSKIALHIFMRLSKMIYMLYTLFP